MAKQKIFLLLLSSFFTVAVSAAPEFNSHYYTVKHKGNNTVTSYELPECGLFESCEIDMEVGDIFYGAVHENFHYTEGFYHHYAPDTSSDAGSSGSVHCTINEGQPNLEHGITVTDAGTYTVCFNESTQTFTWEKKIEESQPQKCATPTISIENGKLQFSCETENAEIQYTIQLSEPVSGKTTGTMDLPYSYSLKITAYATATGYEKSEEATKTFSIGHKVGDVNEDGDVNISDVSKLVDIILKK